MRYLKRIFISVTAIFILSHTVTAQYKVNKTKYDYRLYTYQKNDPYRPVTAGLASFVLPGLGQMTCGEIGRGGKFMGVYAGSLALATTGLIVGWSAFGTTENETLKVERFLLGTSMLVIGIAGALTTDIWSIVDAIRVAKANNMAYRNDNQSSCNINILPYMNYSSVVSCTRVHSGITFRIAF